MVRRGHLSGLCRRRPPVLRAPFIEHYCIRPRAAPLRTRPRPRPHTFVGWISPTRTMTTLQLQIPLPRDRGRDCAGTAVRFLSLSEHMHVLSVPQASGLGHRPHASASQLRAVVVRADGTTLNPRIMYKPPLKPSASRTDLLPSAMAMRPVLFSRVRRRRRRLMHLRQCQCQCEPPRTSRSPRTGARSCDPVRKHLDFASHPLTTTMASNTGKHREPVVPLGLNPECTHVAKSRRSSSSFPSSKSSRRTLACPVCPASRVAILSKSIRTP
ncbi:hypothetical protein C8Q80DRAFT_206676 [Daedaleopsis nitida]|nr:hypothetical protein C8Q80DRAFT_206676 [Daedaleopsis nitida]